MKDLIDLIKIWDKDGNLLDWIPYECEEGHLYCNNRTNMNCLYICIQTKKVETLCSLFWRDKYTLHSVYNNRNHEDEFR